MHLERFYIKLGLKYCDKVLLHILFYPEIIYYAAGIKRIRITATEYNSITNKNEKSKNSACNHLSHTNKIE